MMGQIDGQGDGGDGVLGMVRLVEDGDGVAQVFDADAVNGDLAVIDFALGVFKLYERLHHGEDTCAAGGFNLGFANRYFPKAPMIPPLPGPKDLREPAGSFRMVHSHA
jgi:hypothetical protein